MTNRCELPDCQSLISRHVILTKEITKSDGSKNITPIGYICPGRTIQMSIAPESITVGAVSDMIIQEHTTPDKPMAQPNSNSRLDQTRRIQALTWAMAVGGPSRSAEVYLNIAKAFEAYLQDGATPYG